jgi:hypothetical protein
MTFLIAAVLYPLLLAVLALGAGLLADRVSGGALPGVLLVPFGLAVLVIAGELLSYATFTATVIAPVMAVLALAGLALGRERIKRRKLDVWAIGAALVAYGIACAPVLFAGRPTMGGYLLDTTVGIHLAATEAIGEHARDFSSLEPSSFRFYLEGYIGFRYPTGSYVLLLGAGRLVGQDLIWLYQPHISALLAFSGLVLYFLARAAGLRPPLAALAAVLAAVPALVYGYALQGSIKEITLLPFLLLLGAVLVLFPALLQQGWRAAIPLTLVAAAGIATIGVSFVPWVGLVGIACLVIAGQAVRGGTLRGRTLTWQVGAFVAVLLALALPTLLSLSSSVQITSSLSASNEAAAADPGNLVQPLKAAQMLGIWLNGSHRTNPSPAWSTETWALIVVAAIAGLIGLASLVRGKRWRLLAYVGICAVVWVILTAYGKVWADAKLLVITSPLVVLLAMVGAASLVKGRTRVAGLLLAAVITGGIVASDVYQYRETNLLPTDRYEELIEIGERFAGTGPTLTPDFDEYALYALRDMTPDGPGLAFKNERLLVFPDGTFPALGFSYDLDRFLTDTVHAYPMIVLRRTPEQSRPPSGYRRVFQGRWYDVWRREQDPPTLIEHYPVTHPLSAAGPVPCPEVRRLASMARRRNAELRAPLRRIEAILDPANSPHSSNFMVSNEGLVLSGAGTVRGSFEISEAGDYWLWLRGDFTRPTRIYVDGQPVGEVSHESGGIGNYAAPLRVHLEAGKHDFLLRRDGAGLGPATGGLSRISAVILTAARQQAPVTVSPERWRSLCRQQVDWVEAVS